MTLADLTSRRALAVQAILTAVTSLAALALVGVQTSVLIVQAGAFLIGGLLAAGLARKVGAPGPRWTTAVLILAFGLVLMTLSQPGLDGVRRWLPVGPLTIQPAPLVLPFVAWALASRPAGWPAGGLAIGLTALFAAQPDPSASAGLAVVLAAVLAVRRQATPAEIAALVIALAGLAWAATRPDPLVPVDHVERIVVAAWAAQPLAGVAAALALALIPAPFLLRAWRDRREGVVITLPLALAGLWTALVLAHLTGRFPAPAVGYGASFAVGWLASLGLVAGWTGPARTAAAWKIAPRRPGGR